MKYQFLYILSLGINYLGFRVAQDPKWINELSTFIFWTSAIMNIVAFGYLYRLYINRRNQGPISEIGKAQKIELDIHSARRLFLQ